MKPIYEYIDAVYPWKAEIDSEEGIDVWDKNKVTDMMKEYSKDVVQECIDIIAKHCQESKEMGMIASPDVMVILLEKLKEELK